MNKALLGTCDHNNETRGQRIMRSKIDMLSPDSKQKINNVGSSFIDAAIYKASRINNGLTELFGTNPADKAVGLTNVDKGRVPYDQLVEAILIEYGTDISITDPKAIEFNNLFDGATALPAAIDNCEIEVKVDDKIVIQTIIGNQVFAKGGVAQVDGEGRKVFMLQAPKVLKREQRLEINFRTADGVLLPSGNHFIKATLLGTGIQ